MAKKKKPPERPNVAHIETLIATWISRIMAADVTPYLRYLINTAQAKTKYPLRLDQGMGCMFVDASGAEWQNGGWSTVEDAMHEKRPDEFCDAKILRLREAFPELIELLQLVYDLGDYYLDDVVPSVKPRKDDGTLDPADQVEGWPYAD